MEESKEVPQADKKRELTDDEKKDRREQDSLKLSRSYVEHQIAASTNERYTESLRKALREIDEKLAALGSNLNKAGDKRG